MLNPVCKHVVAVPKYVVAIFDAYVFDGYTTALCLEKREGVWVEKKILPIFENLDTIPVVRFETDESKERILLFS